MRPGAKTLDRGLLGRDGTRKGDGLVARISLRVGQLRRVPSLKDIVVGQNKDVLLQQHVELSQKLGDTIGLGDEASAVRQFVGFGVKSA